MPVSPRCHRVLQEPITTAVCGNFREIRRRVLCDAWNRVAQEQLTFREALRRSWDQALAQCRGE